MSDHDAILNECRALQQDVAPEVLCYTLDAADLNGVRHEPGCMGWADGGGAERFFDMDVADRMGAAYRGPRAIIALDLAAIAASSPPACCREIALRVMLHEIAHLVPFRPVEQLVDTQRIRRLHRALVERSLAAPQPEPGDPADDHGLDFVRYSLHLWIRASIKGWAGIPLRGLLGKPHLSEVHYLPLVAAEAFRMRDATFAEIAATPPPPGLAEMLSEDVAAWRGLRKEKTNV